MLFQRLIIAFRWNAVLSGIRRKRSNEKLIAKPRWGRRTAIWEKKRKGDTYESFARTVKCRECSDAGRISSVIKVMRYLVHAAEYRAVASIMEKARRQEVTKNLVPSETNHLGTFCDGTRENRDGFCYDIFFNIRGIRCGAVK